MTHEEKGEWASKEAGRLGEWGEEGEGEEEEEENGEGEETRMQAGTGGLMQQPSYR